MRGIKSAAHVTKKVALRATFFYVLQLDVQFKLFVLKMEFETV